MDGSLLRFTFGGAPLDSGQLFTAVIRDIPEYDAGDSRVRPVRRGG